MLTLDVEAARLQCHVKSSPAVRTGTGSNRGRNKKQYASGLRTPSSLSPAELRREFVFHARTFSHEKWIVEYPFLRQVLPPRSRDAI